MTTDKKVGMKGNAMNWLLLGITPMIAITHLAWNGVFLGLTTTVILLASVLGAMLLSNLVPKGARGILNICLVAVFTTIAHRLLVAYYPDTVVSLGIFLPLIVVNGIVLSGLESGGAPVTALKNAVASGLGFTLVLGVVGVIREFLAFGRIFGVGIINSPEVFPLIATIPGGMIVVGLLLALANVVFGKGGEING